MDNHVKLIVLLVLVAGCAAKDAGMTSREPPSVPDMHTSRIAVDWTGTYSGVIPCADCEGVSITLTLHSDGRYSRKRQRLGEPGSALFDAGRFDWSDDGGSIVLGEEASVYQVGENVLIQRGSASRGELADGYRLRKIAAD